VEDWQETDEGDPGYKSVMEEQRAVNAAADDSSESDVRDWIDGIVPNYRLIKYELQHQAAGL
jgi:hypothetical protein